MPFRDEIGLTFNCGFCRTVIYECLPKKARKSSEKQSEGRFSEQSSKTSQPGDVAGETPGNTEVEAAGETPGNTEVCALPDVAECFQGLFSGPQFTVGDSYFARVGTSTLSLFDFHAKKVKAAYMNGFRSASHRDRYVTAFSSANWEALSQSEKAGHSLSNCVACATQFQQLQKTFPLKPFFCPPVAEKENVPPRGADAVVRQESGVPFAVLAASMGYKSAAEVKQIVRDTEMKCIRETQARCVSECSSQLDSSALQAVYGTDLSMIKYEKIRKAQFFTPPSEDAPKRYRYPLRPHECENFDKLSETLRSWEPAKPLVASHLAKEFNVLGTDSSHKIRLLARDLNPSIPDLEIIPKPKSRRVKFEGTSLAMPVPPSKRRLVQIDRSLVDGGELKEGVPCVPVKVVRYRNGARVEIEVQGRKFPLAEIRQSLLNAHEEFMRLHSDSEIAEMNREDVLSILQLGAGYSMQQYANITVEDLKVLLTKFERSRTIWIWHDHSSLASHGILAVMVGVVYDSLVFKTESEVGRNVQEYIEEGEIHIVALGSSTLEDQVALIPERLAELEGLTHEITSKSGIRIVDTVRFFKGDRPAAEFEAGVSSGGNYPCVGCNCHRDRFVDFPHAVNCSQRSLKEIQEMALAGHFGKVPGKIRFYDELSNNQLRLELEKRGMKDYPKDKVGRLATLRQILCGVQRVPSLLLFSPECSLSDLNLSEYCVLSCEPLHDLKGYLAAVLKKLPSVLPPSALAVSVCEYLDTLWKKTNLYGSDLREAVVEVAHIFVSHNAQGPAFDFITCLVQVSRVLYSKDSDRSPKQCLQLYNCTFMLHQLHCELFGEALISTYFHALLIHCPVQHELLCSRSANSESEERIFKSAEASAKCTDRKPENMLPLVMKRLQFKRSSKTSNPLVSLQQANSRISRASETLPPYKGTVLRADFVRKSKYACQAHLERIGHFLVYGIGVWWHRTANGDVQFHDGSDDADFHAVGPELLHFRSADLQTVLKRSSSCWDKALEMKVPLPIDAVRCYNSNGDMTAIVVTEHTEQGSVLSEHEPSFDDSFTLPTLPPPQTSTPLRQLSMHEVASPETPQLSDVQVESLEDESSQLMDTEGFVDMAIEEVSQEPQTVLQTRLCKALVKLLGVSQELREFDLVRSRCKDSDRRVLPVDLQRHKSFAHYFRKQISLHKRRLDRRQACLSPSSVEFIQCAKDLKCCLQLICSLQ